MNTHHRISRPLTLVILSLSLTTVILLFCGCGGGSGTSAVVQPPSALSYTTGTGVYTQGTAITPNSPTSTGGAVASYSVSPALPAGLSPEHQHGCHQRNPHRRHRHGQLHGYGIQLGRQRHGVPEHHGECRGPGGPVLHYRHGGLHRGDADRAEQPLQHRRSGDLVRCEPGPSGGPEPGRRHGYHHRNPHGRRRHGQLHGNGDQLDRQYHGDPDYHV
jgi:hypothetical protein